MGGRGGASKIGGGNFTPKNGAPKTLEKFDKLQRDYEQANFSGLSDAQKDAIRQIFADMFAANAFYMNIKSQYLENVIDEHFKNQLETGTGQGAVFGKTKDLSNDRVARSVEMFGHDYRTTTAEEFEKYGSLQPADLLTAVKSSPTGYGDALVRFRRDAVFERTTYTLDDSLGMSTVAGKVSLAQFTGTDRSASTMMEGLQFYADVVKASQYKTNPTKFATTIEGAGFWGGSAYLEIQYHGRLTMADVESITFTNSNLMPSKSVLDRLRKAGVKLYVADGWTGSLTEVGTGVVGEDPSRKKLI